MTRLKQAKTAQNGFVVVVVLCMVIMLAVLLLGFNYKSRTNLRAVDNFRKSRQALNCARAGLNIAIAAVSSTPDSHTNKALLNLLSGENTFEVDEGKCSITISEENGKLNVNLLKDKDGRLNRVRVEQLLRLIDLLNRQYAGNSNVSYGLVPSIVDWIDNDDKATYLPFIKHANLGVESDYYERLEPPYSCRNAPLETTEELLLVKAMTPQVFERICNYVTVYGDGGININSAPKSVIESLSEEMDAALARIIINRRKIKPFDSVTELRDIPGMTAGMYNTIRKSTAVNPTERYYHITVQGYVAPFRHTVVAILRRNMKTKSIDVMLYREL